jgi:hypothetical protein
MSRLTTRAIRRASRPSVPTAANLKLAWIDA